MTQLGVVAQHRERAGDGERVRRQSADSREQPAGHAPRPEAAHVGCRFGGRRDALAPRARGRARARRTGSRPSPRGRPRRTPGRAGREVSGRRRSTRRRPTAARASATSPATAASSRTGCEPGCGGRVATSTSSASSGSARREEGDEIERARVGPVRVVDRDEERRVVGQRREQPVERVHERDPGVGGSCVDVAVASPSTSGRQRSAAPANRRARSAAPAPRTRGSTSCRTTPNGRSSSSAAPRAASTGHPGRLRARPRVVEQRRLADARRPLDDHEPAAPCARVGDQVLECGRLGPAIEELHGLG